LEAARSSGEGAREERLGQLKEACAQAHRIGLERLNALLTQGGDDAFAEAADQVRTLMFIEKFSEELR
ncbi:MAG: iron-sulfur cluster co-chaperone HscB C-terminal domain-containing protein, partial [Burkholderiaceae bacterium]